MRRLAVAVLLAVAFHSSARAWIPAGTAATRKSAGPAAETDFLGFVDGELARIVAEDDGAALRERITELEKLREELARREDTRPPNGAAALASRLARLRVESERLQTLWRALPLSEEAARLKAFIDEFHADLLRARRDLFHLKMKKAVASDAAFYRGFPQLLYARLKDGPQAKTLARTVELRVAGDVHPDNIEIVAVDGRAVPQVNDFDDSGLAPAALDIARAFASLWFISDKPVQERRDLIAEAAKGYSQAVHMDFKAWALSLKDEKSVAQARPRDREWYKNAGRPMEDADLAARLAKRAGVGLGEWTAFDRRGAGLSSIGTGRFMLASKRHAHAYEFKQLRAAAIEFFTGRKQPDSDGERLKKAYAMLRRAPSGTVIFSESGSDWTNRRREGTHTGLDLSHAKSAARVLGGLLAQIHSGQGVASERLEEAARAVTPDLVEGSATQMARFRQTLIDLLNRGSWERAER